MRLDARLVEAFAHGAPVRAVNFHNTPATRAAEYDAGFAAIAERFEAATEDSLLAFLETGRWPGRKPGVVLAFYNGYRDNFDVARPLLERHGLTGWFFVATGYLSCPVPDQLAFGAARTLKVIDAEFPDGRYAMSWDEVRTLDRAGHVIASHTRNHVRVDEGDAPRLREEILGAQDDFVREMGRPARALAWLSGGAFGDNPVADAVVVEAGHDILFSNFRIQRLPRG